MQRNSRNILGKCENGEKGDRLIPQHIPSWAKAGTRGAPRVSSELRIQMVCMCESKIFRTVKPRQHDIWNLKD